MAKKAPVLPNYELTVATPFDICNDQWVETRNPTSALSPLVSAHKSLHTRIQQWRIQRGASGGAPPNHSLYSMLHLHGVLAVRKRMYKLYQQPHLFADFRFTIEEWLSHLFCSPFVQVFVTLHTDLHHLLLRMSMLCHENCVNSIYMYSPQSILLSMIQ